MLPLLEIRTWFTSLFIFAASIFAIAGPSFLRGHDLLQPILEGRGPVDAYKPEINAHLAAQQPAGRPDRQAEYVKALTDFKAHTETVIKSFPKQPPADLLNTDEWPYSVGGSFTETTDPALQREMAVYAARLIELRAFDPIDALDPADAYLHAYDGQEPFVQTKLFYLAYARSATRASTVAASAAAAKGDWAQAARHLERPLRLADIEARRGTLIPRLVGLAIRAMVARTVNHLVTHHNPDAASAALLAEVLARHANVGELAPVFRSERLSSLNAAEASFTPRGWLHMVTPDRIIGWDSNGPTDADRIEAAESPMKKLGGMMLAISTRTRASRREAIRILNAEFDALDSAAAKGPLAARRWSYDLARHRNLFAAPSGTFTAVYCAALFKPVETNVEVQMRYEAARLTLAAHAHRVTTGSSPQSASTLLSTFPAGALPLVEKGRVRLTQIQSGRYVIYALGRDEKDNRGTADEEAETEWYVKPGRDLVYFRSDTPAK